MNERTPDFEQPNHWQTAMVDAEIMTELQKTEPDLVEFLAEMADVLMSELGWSGELAGAFTLDWAADIFFDYPYVEKPFDYYQ